MKRRMIIPLAALALLLAASPVILAQSGGVVDLGWHVFGDAGITTASGGNVTLSGTLGQTAAGRSAGGVVSLTGGFWHAGGGTTAVELGRLEAADGVAGTRPWLIAALAALLTGGWVTSRRQRK